MDGTYSGRRKMSRNKADSEHPPNMELSERILRSAIEIGRGLLGQSGEEEEEENE